VYTRIHICIHIFLYESRWEKHYISIWIGGVRANPPHESFSFKNVKPFQVKNWNRANETHIIGIGAWLLNYNNYYRTSIYIPMNSIIIFLSYYVNYIMSFCRIFFSTTTNLVDLLFQTIAAVCCRDGKFLKSFNKFNIIGMLIWIRAHAAGCR